MAHVYFKLTEASSASLVVEHSTVSLFCQLVCLIEDLSPKQLLVVRELSHIYVVLVLMHWFHSNV